MSPDVEWHLSLEFVPLLIKIAVLNNQRLKLEEKKLEKQASKRSVM